MEAHALPDGRNMVVRRRVMARFCREVNHVMPEHGKIHMMRDTRYMMYMLPDHVEHVT